MTLQHRYDFVLIFDVKNGNPNGDPDAGNLPRTDAETGRGLVSDVCLKRKVRNFVSLLKEDKSPYKIYIKEKAVLNKVHEEAYISIDEHDELKSKKKIKPDVVEKARDWMCTNFYDVRTFGAVMSTGINCGQVRGPVQMTFANSIDAIVPQEHTITRMAVTTEKEAEDQAGGNRTMGRKFTVPYGIYMSHGFISAHLAEQTGFSPDDLKLFLQALIEMFEHDRSAARGEMTTRGLYVFKHRSKLGNCHAHKLFERITIERKHRDRVPRDFSDYEIVVNRENLPAGIELKEYM